MFARRIRTARAAGRAGVLLALLAMLLAAGCVVPPAAPPTSPPGQGEAPPPQAWQVEMLASLNSLRAANGVGPLAGCATLDLAAQRHSEDQAAQAVMSHTGSDGSTPWERMGRAGYLGWTAAAENIASGSRSVAGVIDAWMGSEGHRRNILDPTLVHLGLGLAYDAKGVTYWTQNFGAGGSC